MYFICLISYPESAFQVDYSGLREYDRYIRFCPETDGPLQKETYISNGIYQPENL